MSPPRARAVARRALRLATPEAAAAAAAALIPAPLPPACRLTCALALLRAGFAVEALALVLADAAALLHPSAARVLGPVALAPGLPPGFAAMAAAFLRRRQDGAAA
jgi:hypothetical protein